MESAEQRFRALLGEAFDGLPAPPSPRWIQDRGSRRAPRKRLAVIAVGLAVAVLAVFTVTRIDNDNRGLDTIAPAPATTLDTQQGAVTAQQLATATVTELATLPSSVYAGFKLFPAENGFVLWGVLNSERSQVTAARYSAADDKWTTFAFPAMSKPPNESGSDTAVVFTGTALLVLGRDNLALDLSTGSWHSLPEMPRPLPATTFAFWTGKEAVVMGGTSSATGTAFVGQAFDPIANTWRSITAPPEKVKVTNSGVHSSTEGSVLWTGKQALVFGLRDDGTSGCGVSSVTPPTGPACPSSTFLFFTYDPATDQWRAVPSPLDEVAVPGEGVTDGRTAYWNQSFNLVAGLALDTGQHIRTPALTADDPRLALVGGQLVSLDGSTLTVFDAATNRWINGPEVPGDSAVADGRDLYVIDHARTETRLTRVRPAS